MKWHPDWITIILWVAMIGGALVIWFMIGDPIVRFVR